MIEASAAPDAMRIRSEPIDAAARRFVPTLHDDAPPKTDLAQFDRLADAIATALSTLARLPATVAVLGRSRTGWASDACATTRIADTLAIVLTSIRFGGSIEGIAQAGGVATARMKARLVTALDTLALAHWPDGECGGGVDLELSLAGALHAVWVAAPVRAEAAPAPRPSLAPVLLDQPFRIPIAVSSEMIEIGRLLPFVAGTVWPMAPQPVSALAIGGQRIALVRIEPTPDGRQQAVVVGGLTQLQGDAQ